MANNEKPLGLPKGSVRAILALGTTATTCVSYMLTGQVSKELLSLTTLAWGFYFGQKVATG